MRFGKIRAAPIAAGRPKPIEPEVGPDLLLNLTEAQKAADPYGEVAGSGREDGVRSPATQCEHDFAQLNATGVWRRLLAPSQIVGSCLTRLCRQGIEPGG